MNKRPKQKGPASLSKNSNVPAQKASEMRKGQS